jgi:cholesterol transport system auxiliary component
VTPVLTRLAACAALVLALTGCVTLFPKAEPSVLYRFEVAAPETVAAKTFDVTRGLTIFNQAAASDGILTVTNGAAAYIDGARWVTPAERLFDEQLGRAFMAGPARLTPRGAAGRTEWTMRLEVQRFEAVYRGDPESAPKVVVEIKATLARNRRDGEILDRVFRAEVPAEANRVSAIVTAYNGALTSTLTDLANWVGAASVKPD